ncbi:MAG: DUF2628 domain-containing protein [Methyloceanibacter sp.]
MTVYSVYEPPKAPADLAERADRLAFVKEGFSWPALFVPALWLIYQRMWIELVIFLAIFAVLPFAFGLDRQNEELIGWISFGLLVLFAFEANDLRSAALERRGYRLAGVAMGRDRTEAELSFFSDWLPQQTKAEMAASTPMLAPAPAIEPRRETKIAPPSPGGASEEVIGLFPRP